MISGFWRDDIDTCIYCIEALQLCACAGRRKKKLVKVKKELKKRRVHWMEGKPWKTKKTIYI